MGEVFGACTTLATGWPGIAVPPGSAHSPWGVITQIKINPLSLFALAFTRNPSPCNVRYCYSRTWSWSLLTQKM